MRRLGTYSYQIVGAPTYFDRRGVAETPEDLASHSCLYHRWPSTGRLERWVFGQGGVELDFAPPAALVATTMEPLIGLAERGIGVMYTPSFTVRRQLANGTRCARYSAITSRWAARSRRYGPRRVTTRRR